FVAVPDRIDCALSTRRIYWSDLRLRYVLRNREGISIVPDPIFLRTCCRKHDRVRSDRPRLRFRAGLDGITPRSGHRTAIRVMKRRNPNGEFRINDEARNPK